MGVVQAAEAVAQNRAAIEQAAEELVAREREAARLLAELDADELTGKITEQEADKLRAPIEAEVEAKRSRLHKLNAALPVLEDRLRIEREREHETATRHAEKELVAALQARSSASHALRKQMQAAARAGVELERHRGLVAERHSALVELDAEAGWPEGADEPDFCEDAEQLVALIQRGAEQPHAQAAKAATEAKLTRERQDSESLRWLRTHPHEVSLGQLPEHLRERGTQAIQEIRTERAKAQEPQAVA